VALVIEDGSGVAGATSYASVADFDAFVSARRIVLPEMDEGAKEAALLNAMDYLLTKQYAGMPTRAGQHLPFPRKAEHLGTYPYADDAIPAILVQAQLRAAVESARGVDLLPTIDPRKLVKRRKTDVLETEFAIPTAIGDAMPVFTAIDALLAPLLYDAYDGVPSGQFTIVRA